jgi:hypothetical protein
MAYCELQAKELREGGPIRGGFNQGFLYTQHHLLSSHFADEFFIQSMGLFWRYCISTGWGLPLEEAFGKLSLCYTPLAYLIEPVFQLAACSIQQAMKFQ